MSAGAPAAADARGSSREDAIIDAAMSLVAEIGYDRLTMDAVAARARASKATIYRRWSGKAELVAAGLHRDVRLDRDDVPDTGSLRGDLLAVLATVRRRFTEEYRGLLVGLIRAMQDDPVLAGVIRRQMATNKCRVYETLQRNCAARGETVHDLDLVQEIGPAQVMMRILVTGEPVDEEFCIHLVDRVMLPLLTRESTQDGR